MRAPRAALYVRHPSPEPSPPGKEGGAPPALLSDTSAAMSDISIRDFVAGDTEACAGIFDRAWHAGHPYAPREIDVVAFVMETKDERVLVAEAAGEIAGFVSLYAPRPSCITSMSSRACQGRGIGRALLQRAVALAGGKATLKCQLRNPQDASVLPPARLARERNGRGGVRAVGHDAEPVRGGTA